MSLQNSMLLWIPTSLINEDDSLIEKVNLANGAILDFCDGESSLSDTLETIEYYGADVDEYRVGLAQDLRILGA